MAVRGRSEVVLVSFCRWDGPEFAEGDGLTRSICGDWGGIPLLGNAT